MQVLDLITKIADFIVHDSQNAHLLLQNVGEAGELEEEEGELRSRTTRW